MIICNPLGRCRKQGPLSFRSDLHAALFLANSICVRRRCATKGGHHSGHCGASILRGISFRNYARTRGPVQVLAQARCLALGRTQSLAARLPETLPSRPETFQSPGQSLNSTTGSFTGSQIASNATACTGSWAIQAQIRGFGADYLDGGVYFTGPMSSPVASLRRLYLDRHPPHEPVPAPE